MIVTEVYNGQGLGNQLFCYVTTRCIALDNEYEFGIMSPHKFKCLDFMDLDFGQQVAGGQGPEGGPPVKLPEDIEHYYVEKKLTNPEFNCDVREFDPGLVSVSDQTKIDGVMQSEDYFRHRRIEIRDWLRIRSDIEHPDLSADDVCVINFRGGEYVGNRDLFLSASYWNKAMRNMLDFKRDLSFVVITDDVATARTMFPGIPVHHFGPAGDYSVLNNARYLILSNSSFAFFPVWTSTNVQYVIAPKYWARHNVSNGFWSCDYNLYRDWLWMDREGELFTYDQCTAEKRSNQ